MRLLVAGRGYLLAQAMLVGQEVTERVEAGRPVEEQPWDAEAAGDAGRPRVTPVVDDVARARCQRVHIGLERGPELADGKEEGCDLGVVGDLVGVLTSGSPVAGLSLPARTGARRSQGGPWSAPLTGQQHRAAQQR